MVFRRRNDTGKRAFSLIETLIAFLVAGIAISALVSAFVASMRMAESSAYSLAANSLAVQGLEQIRAAKWDAVTFPNVDEVVTSNFPPVVSVLDVPRSGTNIVYATNFFSITTVSTNPLLKLIRIDCVYRFMNRGLFTNTMVSYRATESGQQNALPSPPPVTPPPPPPPAGTTPKKNPRNKNNN
jgi:Tfp pilus assembly protein PilV